MKQLKLETFMRRFSKKDVRIMEHAAAVTGRLMNETVARQAELTRDVPTIRWIRPFRRKPALSKLPTDTGATR